MERQPTTTTNGNSPDVPITTEALAGPSQVELPGTESLDAKQYKTLGIRVDNDLHARLSFISQLRDSTLSGEIVQAIRSHVDTAQADPELIAKAEEVRAQIEREAEARRAAIAGMFGATALSGTVETAARPSGRRSKLGSTGEAATS